MLKLKRFISIVLCLMMLISLMPASAFADEEITDTQITETSGEDETPAEKSSQDEETPAEGEGNSDEEPSEEDPAEETPAEDDSEEGNEEDISAQSDEEDTIIASGTCGDNLTWTLSEDGVLTISGTGEMTGSPWYSYCESIQSIILPDGLTSIDSYAFQGCSSLTSITIPDSVTWVSEGAFCDCSSLASVTIPDSVTSIGYETFSGCSSLTSITIPSGVTNIESFAFFACSSLTSITIPDSVTWIGKYAFSCCSSLAEINVSSENTQYCSDDGVLFNKEKTELVACPAGKSGEFAVPSGVRSISYGAFWGCVSLTSITIPDSVTSICGNAFDNCSSLTSITIPSGVTSIGTGAFMICSSLESITIPDSVTSIGCGTFSDCSSLKYVFYAGDSDEWSSISIDEDNAPLTSAIIHYNSTDHTYGEPVYTWSDDNTSCTALISCSCDGCTEKIEEVGTVTSAVKTPATSTAKGTTTYTAAFTDSHFSTQTKDVEIAEDPNIIASGTCGDNLTWTLSEDGVLTISGTGAMTEYDSPWDSYSTSIQSIILPDGLTSVGSLAFENCSSLTSITIPDSVTIIGDLAFSGCSSLTSIMIPDSVTSIGTSAFSGCSSLTSITIPDSVTSIEKFAFENCSNLAEINVSSENTQYCSDDGVLFNKEKTELIACPAGKSGEFAVPSGVTTIYDCAFSCCSSLTTISIPDGVTSIGASAFARCSSLTSITIPDGVASINCGIFSDCSSLESITIPDSVTSIEWGAFSNCSGLKYVFYAGDSDEWSSISIDEDNAPLTSAIIHYNSTDHTPGTPVRENAVPATCTSAGSYDTVVYCSGGGEELSREHVTEKMLTPETPAITSASAVPSGITVEWAPAEGAVSYNVYRKNGSAWTLLGTAETCSYTDTAVKPGTKYTYTVSAVNAEGTASGYNTSGVTAIYLTVPQITSVSAEAKGAALKWNAVTGANKYRVYRMAEGETEWTLLTTTSAKTWLDKTAALNTHYTYTVQALNGTLPGAFDETGVSFTYLASPVLASFSASEQGTVITWNAVEGAESYNVYYKNGSAWVLLGNTADTAFTENTLKTGTKYTYTVRAVAGDGSLGILDSKGMAFIRLTAPAITVEKAKNGVTVKWNAVTGANKYYVYRMADGETEWTLLTSTSAKTWLDKTAAENTHYTYTVQAANGTSFGVFDDIGAAFTNLASPVLGSAYASEEGTVITWNAVESAESYNVYYKKGSAWVLLGNTADTAYTDNTLKTGTKYIYTVRAVAADGSLSFYNASGVSFIYLGVPTVTFEAAKNGVTVKWNAVTGANKYYVYRMAEGETGWTLMTATSAKSWLDKTAAVNTSYTYTVRAANGTSVGVFDNSGAVFTRLATPTLKSASASADGTVITWNAVDGAESYNVYYKKGSTWVLIGNTSDTSFTYTEMKIGTKYTYTVRAVAADGSLSFCNTKGLSFTYKKA